MFLKIFVGVLLCPGAKRHSEYAEARGHLFKLEEWIVRACGFDLHNGTCSKGVLSPSCSFRKAVPRVSTWLIDLAKRML